jgi:hypothetical protein
MTDSFWTRVLWSRFIKHFRKLTDEQIIKDIHESMDALEDNDASGDSFGAKMVAWTNERRNEKAAIASRENGNLGGRPRKNQDTTADGDTREDSLDEKSGTSANLYGDASHREAEDESATVSNLFMTKKPSTISTNRRRTGGPSLSQTSSLPPVRQSEPDVMSLAYSGEFGNVRLTQEQYAQLGIKFGNQQKLNRAIDSLSCQIENGEKNPQNHYAELVKWASYRDDMEEKEELRASSAPHYETVSEHNARIVRESDAWIHEYCQQQKKNRKAANG